jgi:polysaccharide biosynthesis/export protein
MKSLLKISGITFLVIMMTSCGSTKNLRYMQGSFDTSKLSVYTFPVPVIQKGDLLGITVYSDAPAATAIYNQSGSGGQSAGSTTGSASGVASSGYLVDAEGNIDFQGIGKLHIEGLNKAQLIDLLNSRLTKFLTNPYYNIRFLNYKITVIGDVGRPAVYSVPSERVNILELLGLAGDLNITARRDNVRIIREINGKREFGEIDLRRPDIFTSPFYQLQQNDVVYVDFNRNKAASNDALTLRNIGIATTLVSTLAILYSIFRK